MILLERIEEHLHGGLSFWDAVMEIVREDDLEPSEFVKTLDPLIIERLKQSALDEKLVRPSFASETQSNELIDGFFH
jgi:hypothetical protein